MLAYNDLKKAQYYFKYLRESEILYKAEPDWRENEGKNVKKLKEEEKKTTKDKSVRTISLDAAEEDLFKSQAQSRAESVLAASKPEQFAPRGRLTQQFREEFKDIFEERIDARAKKV